MYRTGALQALTSLSLLALVSAACERPTVNAQPSTLAAVAAAHGHDGASSAKGVEDELARVRAATARFQRFEVAQDAGYTTKVTDCWEKQPLGAMGFHYADATLIDGAVEVTHPEVLLYEREGNGRMRLVGVEWIIPFDQWHSAEPPTLMGKPLMRNFTFNVWALHAWIWKNNPKGILADWNPNVRC
jgi:hypothetical protein